MQIIAGNCILEDYDTAADTLAFLKRMSKVYHFDLIYKSSWKKDNRSSAETYKGPGISSATEMFHDLKKAFNIPILTDFHHPDELRTRLVDEIDIVQIPAYLCMQTELTMAMAQTGKTINVKKGQFLHPRDIEHIINKIKLVNEHATISLTERGTCFGYRDLVVDPRSIHTLKSFGYPVFVDVGHAIRRYGIPSSDLKLGGMKTFVPTLARVAAALHCGVFVEVHPKPEKALCDAVTQLSFKEFEFMVDNICDLTNG